MKSFLLRLVACLFVVSSSSHAALYDRGNGLIYDDVLDITWMQDANYAQTSGYDSDGLMSWADANTWADQLSYGGFDDWRLPSAGTAPTSGYDVISGELGHMFYTNLGEKDHIFYTDIGNATGSVSFTDATLGGGTESFLNLHLYYYWYGEEYAPDTSLAWQFGTEFGHQSLSFKYGPQYSWAVRDGDVSTVPVPAAAWLFGTALLGLVGVRRRHR